MAKLSSSNGKKANVPKLRFPEFSEEWEEISFSNLFDFLPNNTITRANLSNNGAIRNIHYGDVLIKFGSVLSIRSDDIPFIKNTDTVNNNVFLKNGDIVIADTAEDETVGKVTEIFDIDTEKVVSGLHTIPCRPKKNFAPKFLGYYMNSPAYHYQLFPLMQGVKVLSISKSNIVGTVIHYPDILQQTKITNLLSLIDKKISVQRQLVEALKKYKRGVIKTIFDTLTPVSKSSIGKMATMFSGGTPRSDIVEYYNGSIPFIRSGEIHNDFTELHLSQIGLDNSSAKMVRKGDLLYALYGATSGEVDISKIDGAINQAILCIRTNEISSEYLALWLEINKNNILSKMLQGGQGNLSGELVKSLVVPIYSKTEEQVIVRIGNSINKLIDANTNMLYMLNEAKESLLQQMFI
jgi:type I restriction enzyme S subunit